MIKKEKKNIEKVNERIAIVHDFLIYPGGAERVLDELVTLFPTAPIYTLLYDGKKFGSRYIGKDIRLSFLQAMPQWLRKKHRFLLPFFGTAAESFDLRDYDVIISSSGAWCKGIVTRLNTRHIAYVHSPMRYVWDENEHYLARIMSRKKGFVVRAILSYLRIWDHQAAQRPDDMLANSRYTAERIAKYYRRSADIVYPVVECPYEKSKLTPILQKPYFVVVSRLSEYKNVALAIETCNKLQLDLIVIGEGSQYAHLAKIAGLHVTMVGWADEMTKWRYIAHARALLFPSEDDLGIVCVEALCVNTPVIALGRGGACEIIQDRITGELFAAPTVEMMADALRRFLENEGKYDPAAMQKIAQRFCRAEFRHKILQHLSHKEN